MEGAVTNPHDGVMIRAIAPAEIEAARKRVQAEADSTAAPAAKTAKAAK